MVNVKCMLGIVVLFTLYIWTEAVALRSSTDGQHELTTADRLEPADQGLDKDTATRHGESGAFKRVRRNADSCVNENCKWPVSSDGNVYVPVKIDSRYSSDAIGTIMSSMITFSESTCVRFILRTNEPDYVHIKPLNRCWSSIGRQGGAQTLELQYPTCFSNTGTVQHELLHALGFRHEHARSDRDQHVRVNWENMDITLENLANFWKFNTDNLGTPYDYNSVMHYSRFSKSKNGKPTLEAVPWPVEFGTATEMSPTDIARVNRLYCPNYQANKLLSLLTNLMRLIQ